MACSRQLRVCARIRVVCGRKNLLGFFESCITTFVQIFNREKLRRTSGARPLHRTPYHRLLNRLRSAIGTATRLGSLRLRTSEKTPCVFKPITGDVRFSSQQGHGEGFARAHRIRARKQDNIPTKARTSARRNPAFLRICES
jgi:hypothetical protein